MKNFIVDNKVNIREAAKKLDKTGIGFLIIVNKQEEVLGIMTDGDFRRAIIKGIKLDNTVNKIVNTSFISVDEDYISSEVVNIFLSNKINRIPVISKKKKLVKILFREDFNLADKEIIKRSNVSMPVVIMAGGKGTRMKPFTDVLPKPLIPLQGKSILEVIMDKFNLFYDSKFYISVNYKANLIKAYLEDVADKYQINYIEENKPLGTGGALKFLEGKIKQPFFISNCDIIIKANYQSIYQWHIDNKNDITMIASMIHYKVPYGVCEIEDGGRLLKMVEKPEYDFLVNAGMYIINPETLKHIPKDTFYNITDLINQVKVSDGKVGVFPVSEKSYLDGGQWLEYNNMIDSI